MVLVIVTFVSLAALQFARSMLNARSAAKFFNARVQARMCAESGAQLTRLFVAYPREYRLNMGGSWDNPSMFQALNIMPNVDASRRGNFSIISPSLDQFGNFSGIRFGLQNESAKVNLNALVQLDDLVSTSSLTGATQGSSDGLGGLGLDSGSGTSGSGLASSMLDSGPSLASSILLALPGMTEEVADAILDYLDEDEETRPYGAEFDDYYRDLQTPYKPPNGPIHSIEQLLLVRGVTPQLLFGYDVNRNGYLDQNELTMMNSGIQPGAAPGSLPTAAMIDPEAGQPPPLGWAAYLTLHSAEKNVDMAEGLPRVNINSDDLTVLYEDLVTVLGDASWASFFVAYRMGGQAGGNGNSPATQLATMALATEDDPGGALGASISALAGANNQQQGNAADAEPWDSGVLSELDLSQGGEVRFNQVLDVFDATVTLEIGGQERTFLSPFSGSALMGVANSTPILMDKLTTVDGGVVPGRINIMECPQEILRGIPGLDDDTVDEILEARVDGSESLSRNFETWLVAEGYLTMDEMRGLLPLLTCGGDVFKCQIIGYMEGDSAYSRIETIVSGTGDLPEILFYRRLGHLGRGYDVTTLGQRFDATTPGATGMTGAAGMAGAGAMPGGIQ